MTVHHSSERTHFPQIKILFWLFILLGGLLMAWWAGTFFLIIGIIRSEFIKDLNWRLMLEGLIQMVFWPLGIFCIILISSGVFGLKWIGWISRSQNVKKGTPLGR
jgi:hypothetical protein